MSLVVVVIVMHEGGLAPRTEVRPSVSHSVTKRAGMMVCVVRRTATVRGVDSGLARGASVGGGEGSGDFVCALPPGTCVTFLVR